MSLFWLWVFLSMLLVSKISGQFQLNITKNDSNMTASIHSTNHNRTIITENKIFAKNNESTSDSNVDLSIIRKKSKGYTTAKQTMHQDKNSSYSASHNVQIFNNISASMNNTLQNVQKLLSNHSQQTDASISVNSTRIGKSENAKRLTHHHILARKAQPKIKYEKHKLLKAQPKYTNTKILENSRKSIRASVTLTKEETSTIPLDLIFTRTSGPVIENSNRDNGQLKYSTETQIEINGYNNFKYKVRKRSNDFSYNSSGSGLVSNTGELFETGSGVNAPLWPVKRAAVVEGDLVLGGLMMVHSREDSVTCGPVMPQGGVQVFFNISYLKILFLSRVYEL